MTIRDIALRTARARQQVAQEKSEHLPSRVWDAMVWKNWKSYNKWDKIQIIKQGYERNPAFYAACNIIATTIASIPIYVEYEKRGRHDNTTSHPILKLLERDSSREEFIEMFVLYLLVTGEAYGQIVFSGTETRKRPLGIIPLPSQYITPIHGDQYQPIQYYEFSYRKEEKLYPDEMIAVMKPDLSKYFSGMSPGVPLSELIDLNNAGITWNKNVALAGGMPPVVAKAPGGMTKEEAKDVQDRFQDQSGAKNAHRLKILSADLELENFSVNPHDAEWKDAILTSMRMIFMSFGVSSSLMNDAANKTYNNVKDSRKALHLDACLPIADKIYRVFSRKLRVFYSDNPVIKADRSSIEALQEDQKAQAERLSELKLAGIISANEARSVLKWPKSNDENADLLQVSKQPSQVREPDEPVIPDNGTPEPTTNGVQDA